MFVISSGAKSILDLEKTFEKLETFGIPRIAYNSDFMPGFWYEETNFKVDKNFEYASNTNKKFFNLGPKNNWKNLLKTEMKEKIETHFKKEMKELEYL